MGILFFVQADCANLRASQLKEETNLISKIKNLVKFNSI